MKLNEVADKLRVHPRTILRALLRDSNAYWAPGYDPIVRLSEVAVCFNTSPNKLRQIMHDGVSLYTQKEAAKYVKLPVRTFRWKAYAPALYLNDKIYRYTEDQLDRIRLDG